MSSQGLKTYVRPKDVDPIVASKVLAWLNSSNTAHEIENTIARYAGEGVLGIRIAKKILHEKVELGGFKYLQQVAAVPGIGIKRFNVIVYALSDQV